MNDVFKMVVAAKENGFDYKDYVRGITKAKKLISKIQKINAKTIKKKVKSMKL